MKSRAKSVPDKLSLSKHRKMGKVPKSPKLRHRMKMEAERNEKKAPKPSCAFGSIREIN